MDISVITKTLKSTLTANKLALNKSIFVLTGVLLTLKDDRLILRSTDLENWIETKIPVSVSYKSDLTENSILVPYKRLKSIVDCHRDKNIKLEITKDNTLKVGKMTLNPLNKEDFPEFPKFDKETKSSEIDIELFAYCLDKIKEFTTKEQYGREVLKCYHCDCQNNYIVATDSYKLARLKFDFGISGGFFQLYANTLPILKLFKGSSATLEVDSKNISFKTEDITLITRNVGLKYPEIVVCSGI